MGRDRTTAQEVLCDGEGIKKKKRKCSAWNFKEIVVNVFDYIPVLLR